MTNKLFKICRNIYLFWVNTMYFQDSDVGSDNLQQELVNFVKILYAKYYIIVKMPIVVLLSNFYFCIFN